MPELITFENSNFASKQDFCGRKHFLSEGEAASRDSS
jgi:hypothetical protein